MKHHGRVAPSSQLSSAFTGFRFPPEVIVLAVRWYLRFGLSYRDLEELLAERGIDVDHVTLHRWVQRFTPLLIDAARPCRHAVGRRWFVDETYVKVAGVWRYVYRAVARYGQVIDVFVSPRRDIASARTFYNRVECDHGRLKARLRPMRGLKTDRTARPVRSDRTNSWLVIVRLSLCLVASRSARWPLSPRGCWPTPTPRDGTHSARRNTGVPLRTVSEGVLRSCVQRMMWNATTCRCRPRSTARGTRGQEGVKQSPACPATPPYSAQCLRYFIAPAGVRSGPHAGRPVRRHLLRRPTTVDGQDRAVHHR
jgi:IS6 family transposase